MSKNKEIIVPIFNNEWKVVIAWGSHKFLKKMLKGWGYPKDSVNTIKQEMDGRRGVCYISSQCHPLIFLPKKPKTPQQYGTLAHEAVHAVEHIFNKIKQPLGDEVFAHAVGAVVRETLKQIK